MRRNRDRAGVCGKAAVPPCFFGIALHVPGVRGTDIHQRTVSRCLFLLDSLCEGFIGGRVIVTFTVIFTDSHKRPSLYTSRSNPCGQAAPTAHSFSACLRHSAPWSYKTGSPSHESHCHPGRRTRHPYWQSSPCAPCSAAVLLILLFP